MRYLDSIADRLGVPPRKLLVIALLGCALVLVIAVQWYRMTPPTIEIETTDVALTDESELTGDAIAVTESTSGSSTIPFEESWSSQSTAVSSNPESNRTTSPTSHATEATGSEIPFGRVVRFDPFDAIEISSEREESLSSEPEKSDLVVDAEQQSVEVIARELPVVVDQIVIGPQGATARIGNVWVHTGDRWNGFVVTEIRQGGVVLSVE